MCRVAQANGGECKLETLGQEAREELCGEDKRGGYMYIHKMGWVFQGVAKELHLCKSSAVFPCAWHARVGDYACARLCAYRLPTTATFADRNYCAHVRTCRGDLRTRSLMDGFPKDSSGEWCYAAEVEKWGTSFFFAGFSSPGELLRF